MSADVAATEPGGTWQFRRYPAYKPSGVEWLGEIPAHWEVKRLKSIASAQLSNVDKLSVEGEQSVRLCNYVDVYYNDRITGDLEFMPATATSRQIARFALRKGDVLITKDSESWDDIAVPAVVVEDLPGVLCGYHLALIRPTSQVFGHFLCRAFAAIAVRTQFEIAARGITRYGLGGDDLSTGVFPLPPLAEQHAIATFLDRETTRIDAMVAKNERLIELLQERRTALITRAVTTGLDPNVSMKDSGVEWLGEIPAGWEVLRLRRLLSQVRRPVRVDPDAEYREIGIRSWGKGLFHKDPIRGHLLEEKSVFWIHPGDLVLNIVFAWEGAVAVATDNERDMIGSHRFPTFRHDSDVVDLDYLFMLLQSDHGRALMQLNSPGAAGRNRTIRLDAFLSEEVPVPPLDEQRRIVEEFRRAECGLQETASRCVAMIALLKERRAALISAAVTGQVDVREAAA